jgi:hypothetical protein
MLWKLFQLVVFTAVIFSNIAYNWAWGTSQMAVVAVAFAAAWLSTAVVIAIMDLLRKAKALLTYCRQRIQHRSLTRT